MTRKLPDLIELAAGPMLTPEQRRRLKPPCGKGTRGHVAPPGTGPDGETCGSCAHLFRNRQAKVYLKCGLNRAKWTGGGKTDIRARDHACRRWEAPCSAANSQSERAARSDESEAGSPQINQPVPENAGPLSGTSPNGESRPLSVQPHL